MTVIGRYPVKTMAGDENLSSVDQLAHAAMHVVAPHEFQVRRENRRIVCVC